MGDPREAGKIVSFDIDIPHQLEQILKPTPTANMTMIQIGESGAAGSRTEYISSGPTPGLEKLVVCGKPISWNSGPHRIVFEGYYNGSRFVMSVEEKESLGCLPRGDLIFVAAADVRGKEMLQGNGRDFVIDILSAFIYAATSVHPLFPENIFDTICTSRDCKDIQYERLEIHYVANPESITNQSCELSKQARGCILY